MTNIRAPPSQIFQFQLILKLVVTYFQYFVMPEEGSCLPATHAVRLTGMYFFQYFQLFCVGNISAFSIEHCLRAAARAGGLSDKLR